MTDMTVAKTILDQLGGNRFVRMTGASNFVGSDNALVMKLKSRGPCRTKNGASHLSITLNSMDTYDVKFVKYNRKLDQIVVSQHDGIYCDMLANTFETETGLYTSF
jgi:hypothetical protein